MIERFFTGKNILIISPEGWEHLFVSKHHYAIELAKKNNVFFLNPPSRKFLIEKSHYENLWIINYTPFIKGLRFFPFFFQRYVMRKKFSKIQKLASTKFDCVWSFDNSIFFDFSFLPEEVFKISHIVDFSQNFQLKKAASTADLCLGVSQNIVDRLIVFNKNSFLIPHGISIDNFKETQVVLPGSNLIKSMYAGNLDSTYIDKALLYTLIAHHPEIDFIFLGSGGEELSRERNTFFLGRIPHEFLMSYLRQSDILLLVYNSEEYPNQLTNAHKILEYLLSGKVIVSTFILDYANKPFLIEMARVKMELPALFEKVVSNLSFYNRQEKMEARMEWARNNAYSIRISEVEQLVDEVFLTQTNNPKRLA